MLRVNLSLVLIVTFSLFVLNTGLKAQPTHRVFDKDDCIQLNAPYQGYSADKIAGELYKKAFVMSFDKKWDSAAVASNCAAVLLYGSPEWPIDAHTLVSN